MNYSERFDYAFSVVLEHEGGFSDNKSDPGGATKYGISLRFLIDQGIDIDKDGDVDRDDIKRLTKDNAKEIYKVYWWDKYKYNAIINLNLATKVFDMAVNMGSTRAHKIVQKAINKIIKTDINVDGILGGQTRYYLNLINQNKLLNNIREEQAQFYKNLVKEKPSLGVFLNGWLRRAKF